MRDTHDHMIELLDVKFDVNIYSSLVKCNIDNESLKLRFAILPTDYTRLRKIFEFRPFENTGVSPYRYFFTFSYRKDSINPELTYADI